MGVAGDRPEWTRRGGLTATDTGSGPIPAGTGPAMNRGAGPPTITGAGILAWNWAGIGCRIRNGRQHAP